MNSMTGYGKGQVNSDLGELLIEIKTVNSLLWSLILNTTVYLLF